MIFETIEIENLFCYAGRCVFDGLEPPPGDSRRVIVIWGRNNHGKTSFLNSLKLLFLGTTSDVLRDGALRGRRLGRYDYVFGMHKAGWEWAGILNRGAVARKLRTFRVAATWRDGATEVRAERRWRDVDVGRRRFDEQVTVKLGSSRILRGEQAVDLLHRTLHPRYLPFFLFDGEQVQTLAEGSDLGSVETMEGLLGISLLKRARRLLEDQRKELVGQAADKDAGARLVELRNQGESARAELEKSGQQLGDVESELTEVRRELAEVERELDVLRSGTGEERRQQLIARRDTLVVEIENLSIERIGAALPVEAPLLFNPHVARRARDHVAAMEPAGAAGARAQAELLDSLGKRLPQTIFEDPPHSDPPLLPAQADHYKRRLAKHLEAHRPEPPPAASQMPLATRASVLKKLRRLSDADEKRAEWIQELRQVVHKKAELARVRTELDETEHLTAEERSRKAGLSEREGQLREKKGTFGERRKALKKAVTEATKELKGLAEDLRAQEQEVEKAVRARSRLGVTLRVRAFVDELVEQVREHRRAEIEAGINRHFRDLFSSNAAVDEFVLGSDLRIEARDQEGDRVHRGSLSAGTKQLLAIALLWALKDASARDLPVVVDTPLARLDRAHQDALLERYFPRISNQVIVLPTDSELDRRKVALLEPSVHRWFGLDNPSGARVEIRPGWVLGQPRAEFPVAGTSS